MDFIIPCRRALHHEPITFYNLSNRATIYEILKFQALLKMINFIKLLIHRFFIKFFSNLVFLIYDLQLLA